MSFIKRFQGVEGQWYWIPANMEKEFLIDIAPLKKAVLRFENPSAFLFFDNKYANYLAGEDINNVPKYFQNEARVIEHPVEAKQIGRFLSDFDNLMDTGHFPDEDISDYLFLKDIRTMERFARQAREYVRQLKMIREGKPSLG